MSLDVDGELYFSATEAAKYLGISRDTFYQNVRDRLQPYKHGALKRIYYRQTDLDKIKGIIPIEGQEGD